MNVEIRISDDDIERIARRIIELQAAAEGPRTTRWLTAQGAAEHLSTTEHAIRGMVKRRQIPFYRTETGRILFDAAELDASVQSGSCAAADEDLP
jgi:excisionase family DNA binding protein